ncbi:uncharacterized protein LOC129740558 [Uranotaenia lowii]|uniref:uncharacterized protein LOC129740558 n=1 Tax=Uranotaenia lowii TaxID=190385 RepID=UPI0024791487|nr:uncharacterized protein LOC129740558 [Uranotaenia lowii]
MVLLSDIYCPEQIVIPENFNNVLKVYAKAVIRTQPYDLLRWSAAYFRCLSLSKLPPVKPRYEPEVRRGQLSAGALRVLIDQLGKGYFIQRPVLQDKWQGLCLPEDQLLTILSLLRMLDWTHLHWLKIVAIYVGMLSDSLSRTAEMICELLTEEPEGGSAPIPLWMFQECFRTVAALDCSSVQTFFDGRKVLAEGQLEPKRPVTEMPKVLSTISFKNAIIDKYKSIMDTLPTEPEAAELHFTEDRFSEISEVPSRLDSDFRFVGDETDPYEVVRRAPDFDSVIVLMRNIKDERLQRELETASIPSIRLEQAKERAQHLDSLKETLPEYDYEQLLEAERLQLFRDMGPPWLMLYLFARKNRRDSSYNYLEETSLEDEDAGSVYSNESFFLKGAHKLASPEPELEQVEEEAEEEEGAVEESSVHSDDSSTNSATYVTKQIICKILAIVDDAIADGHCELSVGSISSYLKEKSSEEAGVSPEDFKTFQDFLVEADKKELEVSDLNELYHHFVDEGFKAAGVTLVKKPSHEITSIFEASGIEVDRNLLGTEMSEHMILGLVPAPPEEKSEISVTEIIEESKEPTPSISEELTGSGLVQSEAATQTDALNAKCMELMLRKSTMVKDPEPAIEFNCMIPPIAGIGPELPRDLIEAFLAYLNKRALHQNGMVYPRNFKEPGCPKLD